MVKHPLSSIIVGIILLIGGVVVTGFGLFSSDGDFLWILIYGIPMFVIGVVLLFWRKEDEIEQRKDIVKPLKENRKFLSKQETSLKGGKKK